MSCVRMGIKGDWKGMVIYSNPGLKGREVRVTAVKGCNAKGPYVME